MANALKVDGKAAKYNGKAATDGCKKCCGGDDGEYVWPTEGWIVSSGPCEGQRVAPPSLSVGKPVLFRVAWIKDITGGSVTPSSCVTMFDYNDQGRAYCWTFQFNGTRLNLTQAQVDSGAYYIPNQIVTDELGWPGDCCACSMGTYCTTNVPIAVNTAAHVVSAAIAENAAQGFTAVLDFPTRINRNGIAKWYGCCANWNNEIFSEPGSGIMSSGTAKFSYEYTISGASEDKFNGHSKLTVEYSWGGMVYYGKPTLEVTRREILNTRWDDGSGNSYDSTTKADAPSIRCIPFVLKHICSLDGYRICFRGLGGENATGTSFMSPDSDSFSASQSYSQYNPSTGGTAVHTNSASGSETITRVGGNSCAGCGGATAAPICNRILVDGYSLTVPPSFAGTAPPTGPGDFLPVEV